MVNVGGSMWRIIKLRVKTYLGLIYTSFLQRLAYIDSTWINIVEGVLAVFLQVSLWKALINSGTQEIVLEDMIAFVIVNSIAGYISAYAPANNISNKLEDGMIAIEMILPINFKLKLFSENLGNNLYDCLFSGIPGLLVAVICFRVAYPKSLVNFLGFMVAILLGMCISYNITYIFGLTAFWIIKPWYIKFLVNGLTKLLGGLVVPLWFYSDWLFKICDILPFKYITYVPIEIYLGRYKENMFKCFFVQIVWLVCLISIEKIIWEKAKKSIFVQGG